MIIGLTGPLAAGKGTISKYLEKNYQAQSIRFSDPLRDIINRLYHDPTRETMSSLAVFLRSQYGEDILIQTLLKDIDAKGDGLFILDGLRYPEEDEELSKRDDFELWAVDTKLETRYQRIIIRDENESDKKLTLDEFKAQHSLKTEQYTPALMKKADRSFNNDGTLQQLYDQVEKAIKELGL
ncbi:AAA family ATPase [Patescibacteria group bacterium]